MPGTRCPHCGPTGKAQGDVARKTWRNPQRRRECLTRFKPQALQGRGGRAVWGGVLLAALQAFPLRPPAPGPPPPHCTIPAWGQQAAPGGRSPVCSSNLYADRGLVHMPSAGPAVTRDVGDAGRRVVAPRKLSAAFPVGSSESFYL